MEVYAFAYLVVGYLYLMLSSRTNTADKEMRICIWMLWPIFILLDILKMIGKFTLRFFEAITEAFD